MAGDGAIWMLVGGTFLLAGVVKGVIGLGLPTVAMGLLGLAMTPAQAASLLLVPSLVTNVWQLWAGPGFWALLRRLWGMMLGVFAGTVAASGLIAGAAPRGAGLGLGVAIATYGVVGLVRLRMRVPPGAEGWAGPAVGLERDDLVQALGLSFTVSTVALAVGLAWHGALPWQASGASLAALMPALLGMAVGGWLRGRVSAAVFRSWFFAGLLVLGLELIWRGA